MPPKSEPLKPSPKLGARAKRGRGRPAFKPLPEHRRNVEFLAAVLREDQICQIITHPDGTPISENTLRKHFRVELDSGHSKADAMVAQGLYRNATTATARYPGGDPTSQIFWLKSRARWRTVERGEALGDEPLKQPETPEQMDDQDTARRLAYLLAAGAGPEPKKKIKA